MNKRVSDSRLMAVITLSLVLAIVVFWWLKLIGITQAGQAFCGMDEHIHTSECQAEDVLCRKTEHTHTASCYSDINADVESEKDWKKTMSAVNFRPNALDNVLAVARSQLGYEESSLNFKVTDTGARNGYTRYGEWFGNPYGNWATMFVSFCLEYAGVEDVPLSSGARTMQINWASAGLFEDARSYRPIPGDVVFLDIDRDGMVDSTAIVDSIAEDGIVVIEGDRENTVAQTLYYFGSEEIYGYGIASLGAKATLVGHEYDDALTIIDDSPIIANTVTYSTSIFNNASDFVVYTVGTDGKYYAIDGNGAAVEIFIDANGNVRSDVANTNSIIWNFTRDGNENGSPTYFIYNNYANKYLHPYYDNANSHGAVLTGKWESALITNGSGVKIKGARQANGYARLINNASFTDGASGSGATFYFAKVPDRYAVWLDGTNGGLRSLVGSPDTAYFVYEGSVLKLPTEWRSPTKSEYVLKGWYDIINRKYHKPGDEITVTAHMVFYADWKLATYDIGQYNEKIINTISTNEYITTRVYDFGALFNTLSANAAVNVSSTSHSETWSIVQNGTLADGTESLNYIFVDYDAGGDLSYPNNRGTANNSQDTSTTGLYNPALIQMLFGTDDSVVGRNYLGSGDYLFHFEDDPTKPHFGYYYYDSKLNAASYNQSDGRFYIYNYLERTADTARDGGVAGYSDFLPLNSPYANTNGQNVVTYAYNGDNGEFPSGTTHYQYDSAHSGGNNAEANVNANYWYGMTMDVSFYLSDTIGSGGNKDAFGNGMHFHFAGDDDVWILIDGVLVLDLGGIHDIKEGDINFSTGAITREGRVIGNLSDYTHVDPGEHILTVYYLERGGSKSNCELYYNLSPRFDFQIRKEDVLTTQTLDGAEFSVYMDAACTIPAQLWESREVYENGGAPINVFRVENGYAHMWGLTTGYTYYVKETKAPDDMHYSVANGIICLKMAQQGFATYDIEILKDGQKDISPGFTVHNFTVDIRNQTASFTVTNAQDWVREITSVDISKGWDDNEDHSNDLPTFYLLVKGQDGYFRRIREVKLGEDNNWGYTWTNLPKYYVDSAGNTVSTIEYRVEEAYYAGYAPTVEQVQKVVLGDKIWAEAYQFENGETYVLSTAYGCLATQNNSSRLTWITNIEEAKTSPRALWTATVSHSGNATRVVLRNQAGYTLQCSCNWRGVPQHFNTTSGSSSTSSLYSFEVEGKGISLGYTHSGVTYYMGPTINGSGNNTHTTNSGSAVIFTPLVEKEEEIVVEDGSFAYRVTNTPIDMSNQVSVVIHKQWDMGIITSTDYQMYQIPITLYANGEDSGRYGMLTLQNGWTVTFEGLPYTDEQGNFIRYTVKEHWDVEGWEIIYGDMYYIDGSPGRYTTTITNRNLAGKGQNMPATGGLGGTPYVIVGLTIMFTSAIGACVLRRKRERRGT